MGKAARGKKGGPAAVGPAARLVGSNPFEVKVNKQKFRILGRKTKHDVGLPGVSRSKAHRKVSLSLVPPLARSGSPSSAWACAECRS